MKNLTLENIVAVTGGQYHGDASLLQRQISAVTTDSRTLREGCLFAAIKGERSDGHDYIASALQNGALCALCERLPEDDGLCCIVTENTIAALGDIAAFYRRQFDIPLLGVTGSVGKTTAKEMVSAVLGSRCKGHKTAANLNNDLGVPLTLFGLDDSCQFAVVEMGISHFGEMTRLAEIAQPTMALFTAIGSAHLEFLGDHEGVLRAKTEMLPLLPEDAVVFVNGDDELLSGISCKQKLCKFGLGSGCDVTAENVRILGTEGMEFTIVSGERRIPVKISAYGVHLISAALGAAAVGMAAGLSDREIADGLAAYKTVGSRAGIIQTGSLTIIDDCYNANPDSVASGIDSLALLRSGRRVCILGDMRELGAQAQLMHYRTGEHAASKGIDAVFTCGELSESIAAGAEDAGCENVVHFGSRDELISFLPQLVRAGDIVLVKASHSMEFEKVVEALKALQA